MRTKRDLDFNLIFHTNTLDDSGHNNPHNEPPARLSQLSHTFSKSNCSLFPPRCTTILLAGTRGSHHLNQESSIIIMCRTTILQRSSGFPCKTELLVSPSIHSISKANSNPPPLLRRSSDQEEETFDTLNSISDLSWTLDDDVPVDSLKDETTSTSNSIAQKSVSFGTVQVHEHAMILGDHPCACGPPVTIHWKPSASHTFASVQDFEDSEFTRRRAEDLRIPVARRLDLLLRRNITNTHCLEEQDYDAEDDDDDYCCCTLREILQAQAEAQQIADRRARSAHMAERGLLIRQWFQRHCRPRIWMMAMMMGRNTKHEAVSNYELH